MESSVMEAATVVNQPAGEISDSEVLQILKQEGRCMTYVVRNWLAMARPALKTSYVRRRLERLEREGLVQRAIGHSYATQICWEITA